MTSFTQFLEECKEEYNHLQQNVKRSFELGWKPLFEYYRDNKSLPDTIGNKHIILSGLEEYGLTDEEAFFIVSFTGSYSSWINRPLRDGYDLQTKCTRYFADNLDRVLDKVPCFNDQYVFRMDTPSGPTLQVLNWFYENIGNVVTTPYFLSTSKENFESTEITWHIKTRKNNSKGRDLVSLTNNTIEKEVLFKRDALFKIKSVDYSHGIVEMEEVQESDNLIKLTGFYFET